MVDQLELHQLLVLFLAHQPLALLLVLQLLGRFSLWLFFWCVCLWSISLWLFFWCSLPFEHQSLALQLLVHLILEHQSLALRFGASAFGSSFGASAFGASAFGSSFGASAFGASAFGSSFGASAFGASAFGSSFGASAFGSSAFLSLRQQQKILFRKSNMALKSRTKQFSVFFAVAFVASLASSTGLASIGLFFFLLQFV